MQCAGMVEMLREAAHHNRELLECQYEVVLRAGTGPGRLGSGYPPAGRVLAPRRLRMRNMMAVSAPCGPPASRHSRPTDVI